LLSFSVSITRLTLLLGLLASTLVGCGEREANGAFGQTERAAPDGRPDGGPDGGPDSRVGDRVGDRPGRILIIGTSLTAAPGVAPEAAYPALLQQRIDADGLDYQVVNAGVSGETSAGALRRLDWLLREPADLVIVETGANDMLRGQDPDSTRANLDAILTRLNQAEPRPRVLLVPMQALPNLGRGYGRRFESMYPELARRHGVTLLPFLLDGVAGETTMNLADGIHPNARGHERIARNLWPGVREAVVSMSTSMSTSNIDIDIDIDSGASGFRAGD
jgi:acyl-CoA thioesterase I